MVPAWWSLVAPSPAAGTLGDTAATHSGELSFNPNYVPANGAVSVWADTAADAVSKAFVGVINVTTTDQSLDYVFGPDTVGTTAADQKPFIITVSGTSVGIAFEDMAGQSDCDYDYNDQTWSGVTATEVSAGTPVVIDSLQATWHNPDAQGETMTVTSTVTYDAPGYPGEYRWQYHVTNNDVGVDAGKGAGVYNFSVPASDASAVTSVELSNPWASGFTTGYGIPGQLLSWVHLGETDPDTLLPGESADFAFASDPIPVAMLAGESLGVGAAYAAVGLLLAPAALTASSTDLATPT